MTVDVYAFHKKGLKPPIKKTMSFGEFHKLKSKDYYFRAYQVNFNVTIL
jgi:hypothetical protein